MVSGSATKLATSLECLLMVVVSHFLYCFEIYFCYLFMYVINHNRDLFWSFIMLKKERYFAYLEETRESTNKCRS